MYSTSAFFLFFTRPLANESLSVPLYLKLKNQQEWEDQTQGSISYKFTSVCVCHEIISRNSTFFINRIVFTQTMYLCLNYSIPDNRAGRYDGIYRATVEMCLPGEIGLYRFNRGILLFWNPIDLFLDNDLQTIHPAYYTVTRQNDRRHSSKIPLTRFCCRFLISA